LSARGTDAVGAHQPLQLLLLGSATTMRSLGSPRLVKPPISAAAMLPPPMNASLRMLFMPSRSVSLGVLPAAE
jgi:hypothetical protein